MTRIDKLTNLLDVQMTQGITTAAKKAGDAAKAEKEEKHQNAPRQQ